jgi:hypothetical protein
MDSKECRRKWVWYNARYCPGIYYDESQDIFGHDSWSP